MADQDHAGDAVGVAEEEAEDELVVLLLVSCLIHHLVEQVPDRHAVRLKVAGMSDGVVGRQSLPGVEGDDDSPEVQLLLLLLLGEPAGDQRLEDKLSCPIHPPEVRQRLEGQEDELKVLL
eukprot:751820-Hanusia_phi.AAC.3